MKAKARKQKASGASIPKRTKPGKGLVLRGVELTRIGEKVAITCLICSKSGVGEAKGNSIVLPEPWRNMADSAFGFRPVCGPECVSQSVRHKMQMLAATDAGTDREAIKHARFATYAAASLAHEDAKHALAEAAQAKSMAVKAILDLCGPGPFRWQGKKVKPTRAHSGTYFLRGEGERPVEEVS
jgi:hypothetical protein